MEIFKTYTHHTDRSPEVSWQASLTEAAKQRAGAKSMGLKAETQTVNIPTAKGPLVAWLNANVHA